MNKLLHVGRWITPPFHDPEPTRLARAPDHKKTSSNTSTFKLTSTAKYGLGEGQDIPRLPRASDHAKSKFHKAADPRGSDATQYGTLGVGDVASNSFGVGGI